jgi:hypothetical protein
LRQDENRCFRLDAQIARAQALRLDGELRIIAAGQLIDHQFVEFSDRSVGHPSSEAKNRYGAVIDTNIRFVQGTHRKAIYGLNDAEIDIRDKIDTCKADPLAVSMIFRAADAIKQEFLNCAALRHSRGVQQRKFLDGDTLAEGRLRNGHRIAPLRTAMALSSHERSKTSGLVYRASLLVGTWPFKV